MESPYKIEILSLAETDLLLSSSRGASVRNVISIGDPGSPEPRELHAHDRNVLRIECKDVFPEDKEVEEGAIPRKHHVERIMEFGSNLREGGHAILIHCHAGVSRSTAAALILLYRGMQAPDEETAVRELLRLRPQALPNKFLIQHADSIMNSNLLRACEPVYRTRAARIMNSFRRQAREANRA